MPMHLCAVRQLKDAPRLHRILHKNLHFPRSAADIVVRGVKLAINPRQAAVRRRCGLCPACEALRQADR